MPIGVPKVAYRLPGETSPQWVDLYNRLYVERLLFFCQELEDELANQLIGIMVYLNAEDTSQELFMYINSPGGSVINGIAVFDTFDFIEADVNTICAGTAASMASFVLCNGTRDKRIALPHARIMIHQPIGGSSGQVSDVVSESEHVMSLRRQVCKLYSDRTGQPTDLIGQDMDRDRFLSPKEAKSYGLVDKVAVDW